MRYTLNIKADNAAALQKALRSAAAKITADDLTPGADVKVGNVRVQVSTPKVSTIRQFALDNADTLGWNVGSRGRYPKHVIAAYEAHVKAERKAARDARAARKAEREAVSA